MARDRRRPKRRWLARVWPACVLTAVVVSVAGCVGMPNSGSPGTFGATPQDPTQDSEFIRALPAGPERQWDPAEIVQGFLNASASYPVYSAVAKQYLVRAASKKWDPGWTVKVVDQVSPPRIAYMSPGSRQATVDVTGTVRASFNGSGQYVGAQQNRGGAPTAGWQFKLVKVDGQWRITNPPPNFRMLNEHDFSQVYKPQDLYFFDWSGEVLVPAAVFVPAGTSPTSLVSNLVRALLKAPQTPWLQGPADTTAPATTAFLNKTTIISVAVDGTTATVNLGGAAVSANDTLLEQISAQLVWTLTGQQQQVPQAIQAVQLEINGKTWMPQSAPCAGTAGLGQSPAQKLAMYGCYNPYPTGASPSFYYVGHGQAWSRCALESQVTAGTIGPVVPVFSRASVAQLNGSCGRPVPAHSPAIPPPQPRNVPALSMVAVSPDGKYAAGVSANGNAIYVWPSGSSKPSNPIPASGVSTISWDRIDNLWVTENDATCMVTPTSNGSISCRAISNDFGGKITGLSVAPDGVRVAAIALTGSGSELELAAIDRNAPASGQQRSPFARPSIGPAVQLGPNIADPIALTWYDADDLLVLDGTGSGTTLWEVPVDGQPATGLPGVLPGAISITANSAQNALVIGLSSGQLEVSASLEGPWQPLVARGQNPAFPTPLIQVPAQPSTLRSRYVTIGDWPPTSPS